MTNAEKKQIEDDLGMIKKLCKFKNQAFSEANQDIVESKLADFEQMYGKSELKYSDYKIENRVAKHRQSLTWPEIT